ncbi:hypothetical protein [Viridibacillus arvi]|uniref:hypothetical protein n=1 Tax=Viridibacillus arvi TaxID=263475 RepID=UPI003D0855FC
MEILGILPVLLFYILPIVFIIWFAVNMVKLQKEKNEILRTIAKRLDNKEI